MAQAKIRFTQPGHLMTTSFHGNANAFNPELTITTYCLPLRPIKLIGLV
jgi:hypothetical protein